MLPWGQWLRMAQRAFTLTPDRFWTLSVLEWRLLQTPERDHADRTALKALMTQFPDPDREETQP